VSFIDPYDSTGSGEPAGPVTLAARRPGHAAMTALLRRLERRRANSPRSTVLPRALHARHVGAVGEQLVGQELALLPEPWRVLHAVPAGSAGAHIDHLVIGPGGVFVLDTLHRAPTTIRVGTVVVRVDGLHEGRSRRELLKHCDQVRSVLRDLPLRREHVVPMLVLVRPERVAPGGEQRVAAVRSDRLVPHLLSLPPVLEAAEIAVLARRAEEPSAWGASASVLHEPDPTMRFLALTAQDPQRRSVAARPGAGRRTTRRTPSVVAGVGLGLLAAPATVVDLLRVYVRILQDS
jgi:hypothetical protein